MHSQTGTSVRTRFGGTLLTLTALAVVVGCSAGPAVVTVTRTVQATAAPAASTSAAATQDPDWPVAQGSFVGAPPPFPSQQTGWQVRQQWTTRPRAFLGQWTQASDADWQPFPATMNGCDGQRFLVRWRSLSPQAPVTAAWLDSAGEVSDSVAGASGWMVSDGCHTPQVTLAGQPADGSTLVDVTMAIQQLEPTP